MQLTDEQLETWRRDGSLVVPDVFPPEEHAPALEAVERNAYGGLTYAEYRAKWEDAPTEVRRAYEQTPPLQRLAGPLGKAVHFPTGLDAVDRLLENDDYLDIACQLLGTPEIRLGYGQIFFREGVTDTRYSEHPWEGYHLDNGTNAQLPPHPDWERYNYVLSGIILHDIEEDGAPMLVCPGSHKQLASLFGRHQGRAGGLGLADLREFEELAEPVPVTAKAGSVAFRSSYLIHAAQPFANKNRQRGWMGFHFHRQDNADWCKTTRPVPGWTTPEYMNFVAKTTPRVRRVLGWPAPGDPYYTEAALQRLAQAYPGMDLTPYRSAMAG
ncbi:MAG: phytanoyl-CoA dioxygenase family protein [Candidatus Poribacteria bacterium]|nr:phytanoyl-CoA dioxygenase family protein [Candidatus Poribacteria bacterium]